MITTIEEARLAIKTSSLVSDLPDAEIDKLLEATAKLNLNNIKVYRTNAALISLLQTNPDLWLIQQHDRTTMRSPAVYIQQLLIRQNEEDAKALILTPMPAKMITVIPPIWN